MTLRVDGEGLPAHRLILGARSTVSKAMFNGGPARRSRSRSLERQLWLLREHGEGDGASEKWTCTEDFIIAALRAVVGRRYLDLFNDGDAKKAWSSIRDRSFKPQSPACNSAYVWPAWQALRAPVHDPWSVWRRAFWAPRQWTNVTVTGLHTQVTVSGGVPSGTNVTVTGLHASD